MSPRRSRTVGVSPVNKTAKKSVRPNRGRSKSDEKNLNTRSRSKKRIPIVVLDPIDKISSQKSKKDIKTLKSVEPVLSKKSKSSTTSVNAAVNVKTIPAVDKLNNDKKSTLRTRSIASRSTNRADNKPQLLNNKRIKNPGSEFGGSFGNLILVLFFPFVVILSKIALENKGILIPFPRGYLQFGNYYDQDVFIWSAALVVIQLLLSLVPLAKKTAGLEKYVSKRCYYRFSGFMNLVVGALIVAGLEYYKFSIKFILDMVTRNNVPHIVASILFAVIVSLVIYVNGKLKKQISEFSNLNFFQKIFIGTSLNPTLGPINIKLALYRYSLLLTILCNYLVVMDSLKNSVNLHLYVVAAQQIIYALDKLVFEFNLLSSFYLQTEKFGYWTIIQLFLLPAINFLPIQILLTKTIPANYRTLGVSSILFLLGYICQRYSDYVKYQYETSSFSVRRSIYHGGKKSTYYNLWLYVRYPNYLGAIIAHFAIILPTIEPNLDSLLVSWPVFVYALYYLFTLCHQCVRVSTKGSWDQQVASKWNLIPKIF